MYGTVASCRSGIRLSWVRCLCSTYGRQSLGCSFSCERSPVGVWFRSIDCWMSRKLDVLVLLGFFIK